jgi:hypothetical protein
MMSADATDSAAETFASLLELWGAAAADDLAIEDVRVTGDVPAVRFQAISDDVGAADEVADQLCGILGGAMGVIQKSDDPPDVVDVVGLPSDRETHEGGIRWRLRREWAEAYDRGELTSQEVLKAVDETAELLEA